MGWFGKKRDPIDERERQLKQRLAALEGQIRQLTEGEAGAPAPRYRRSTTPRPPSDSAGGRPEFEEIPHPHSANPFEAETSASHYNELGIRKYDLVAAIRRWWTRLRGRQPPTSKLVSYLAAGSIHGLPPLRYEKRIARNRFLALFALFLAILWGLVYFYFANQPR